MQKTKKRNGLILILLVAVFIISVMSVIGAVDPPSTAFYNPSYEKAPKLTDSTNIDLKSAFNVDLFTGSVNYFIPIELPEGTNGLKPTISLSYSSQRVNDKSSLIASGWLVTENYIQRDVNYTASNVSDDFFELNLGGQISELIYSSTNNRYYTEIESYNKINNYSGSVNNSNGEYWIIKATDGISYRFGFNNDSELRSNQQPYVSRWYLDLITDTFGNNIYYSYNESPTSGEFGITYPYKIEYNNDKKRVVEFILDDSDRSYSWTYYDQGNKVHISNRIKEISVTADNSLVRKYLLDYNNLSTQTVLIGIRLIGSDNSSSLPPINFSYIFPDKEFNNQSNLWDSPVDFIGETISGATNPAVDVVLIDVNRDGFLDILSGYKSSIFDNNQVSLYLNNRTTGWDKSSPLNFTLSLGMTAYYDLDGQDCTQYDTDRGIRELDLNGDGFIDFIVRVQHLGETAYPLNTGYLWNGTGWQQNSSWSSPAEFVDSQLVQSGASCEYNFGVDQGIRFADLNGDGLEDLITTNSTWIHSGSAWVSTNNWKFSNDILTTKNVNFLTCRDQSAVDLGVRFIDINGDGLSDSVISRDEDGESPVKKAYINNGTGFIEDSSWSIPVYFVEDNIWGSPECNTRYGVDKGIRFLDVNQDGFVDILEGIGNERNVYINNGTGWEIDSSWNLSVSFVTETSTISKGPGGIRVADVNGDGAEDLVQASDTWENEFRQAYLLKNVTTSNGGLITFEYMPSSLLDNTGNDSVSDLGFNIWVVANVTQNNGITGIQNVNSTTVYNYSGGLYDYGDREFRGFNYVEGSLDNKKIKHWFHQDISRKGLEYENEILSNNGDNYEKILSTWSSTLSNSGNFVVKLSEKSELTYDGEISNPKIKNTSYSYDEFGNTVVIHYKGDITNGNDDKYEYFNYLNNSNLWIVDKVKNYSLLSPDNSTKLRETLYTYDNLAYGVDPTKGSLTSLEEFLDNGDNPVANFSYDLFGNLVNVTDANGHRTEYIYGIRDTTNTYADRIINAKGHIFDYNYDLGTGNLLSETDGNLMITNYTYDTFGRIISEIRPLDSEQYPTKNYSYVFDGVAPEIVKVSQREISGQSGTFDQITFYDGFGRGVQLKLEAKDNQQVVSDLYYDLFGRIEKRSNPYFASYSESYTAANQTVSVTTYSYDQLDRLTITSNPDGTYKNISYDHWNVTLLDENNNRKDYELDSYGRILEIKEHNDAEIYTTIYSYDGADSLISITDSLNNAFNWTYDTLGRKIIFNDPDLGSWNYSYDGEDNLISQTDNRGITLNLEYDEINRIIRKSSSNEEINYTYDMDKNNTLSSVNEEDFVIDYSYDNRLRKTDETKAIDGFSFTSSWTYDAMDRATSKVLPDGNSIVYQYGNQNLLESINEIANFTYNENNQITSRAYENALNSDYAYDGQNLRLERITTSGNIQDLSYNYDAVGNVIVINDTANSNFFSMDYDDLDRLIYTSIDTLAEDKVINFTYNAIGNMLGLLINSESINYSYGPNLAHAPISVIYDDGSLSSQISLDLISPSDIQNPINVSRGEFFNITVNVTCMNADCGEINVSFDPLPEETSYTPSTQTICKDGICTTTIYSGIRFVQEEGQWKKIEDAKSLKGVWQVIEDEDPNFPADVIDFNYTSITIDLAVSNGKTNKEIDLKVYNKNDQSEKPKDKNGRIKNKDTKISLDSVDRKSRVSIDLSDTDESILGQEIKWGDASTFIQLQEPDTENLDDTYVHGGDNSNFGSSDTLKAGISTTSRYSYLKFNTSIIPEGVNVISADLYLRAWGVTSSGSSYINTKTFESNSSNWQEHLMNWSNQVGYNWSSNSSNFLFLNSSLAGGWHSWDITNILQKNIDLLSGDVSLTVAHLNYSGILLIDFRSKEYSIIPEYRPTLNITYTEFLTKGLISTNIGDIPFYTNGSNPVSVNLSQGESEIITIWVNATGNIDSNYTFFVYANQTADMSISDITPMWEVSIEGNETQSVLNDTYKFYIKDSLGNNVSWFGSGGNIVLKGSCFAQSNCVTNDGSSFIIGNATDSTTAFINSTGDLCIEQGDCTDLSVSCNPTSDAFIIKNSSSANVAYINYNGDLCLTGSLFENSNP